MTEQTDNSHRRIDIEICDCQGTPLCNSVFAIGNTTPWMQQNVNQGFTCNGQMCQPSDKELIFTHIPLNGIGSVTYKLIDFSYPTNTTTLIDQQNSTCPVSSIPGCTDPLANNYDPTATVDDGSCAYTGTWQTGNGVQACDCQQYISMGGTCNNQNVLSTSYPISIDGNLPAPGDTFQIPGNPTIWTIQSLHDPIIPCLDAIPALAATDVGGHCDFNYATCPPPQEGGAGSQSCQELWTGYTSWINTFTTNSAFTSSNPLQPCQHICNKIEIWHYKLSIINPSKTDIIARLNCKIEDGENQAQIHGCNC